MCPIATSSVSWPVSNAVGCTSRITRLQETANEVLARFTPTNPGSFWRPLRRQGAPHRNTPGRLTYPPKQGVESDRGFQAASHGRLPLFPGVARSTRLGLWLKPRQVRCFVESRQILSSEPFPSLISSLTSLLILAGEHDHPELKEKNSLTEPPSRAHLNPGRRGLRKQDLIFPRFFGFPKRKRATSCRGDRIVPWGYVSSAAPRITTICRPERTFMSLPRR